VVVGRLVPAGTGYKSETDAASIAEEEFAKGLRDIDDSKKSQINFDAEVAKAKEI